MGGSFDRNWGPKSICVTENKVLLGPIFGVCTSCKVRFEQEQPSCTVCSATLKTEAISYDERLWDSTTDRNRRLRRPKNEELLKDTLASLGIDRRRFLGMLETIPRKALRAALGDEAWNVRWDRFTDFHGEKAAEANVMIQAALNNTSTIALDLEMFRRILRYECGTFFNTTNEARFKVADLERVLSNDSNFRDQLNSTDPNDRLRELAHIYKDNYRSFVGLIKKASAMVPPENEYPIGYDASMEVGYWIRYNKYGR